MRPLLHYAADVLRVPGRRRVQFFFLLVALLLKVNLDGDASRSFFSYIVGVLTVVPIALPVGIKLYIRLGGFGEQTREMKDVFNDHAALEV